MPVTKCRLCDAGRAFAPFVNHGKPQHGRVWHFDPLNWWGAKIPCLNFDSECVYVAATEVPTPIIAWWPVICRNGRLRVGRLARWHDGTFTLRGDYINAQKT